MDKSKIAIEGIRIFAHHGYYEEERIIGKEFILDVFIEFNFDETLQSDFIGDTINYEEVIDICLEEMKTPSKLLEPIAIRIAQRISHLSTKALLIKVRIQKPHPILKIEIDKFYVEYETSSNGTTGI